MVSWPGSYHVVLEDADGVAIYGDLAGARPVFYAGGPEGVRFASAALPLSASLDAGMDQAWLATTLLCPSAPELVADRSPFAGVAAVAPGNVLCVSRAEPRTRRVWAPCPGRATLAEGGEALRDALTAGVGARIAHAARLTSDLSGGLDSFLTPSSGAPSPSVCASTTADHTPSRQSPPRSSRCTAHNRLH